jgi:hypothetical protein
MIKVIVNKRTNLARNFSISFDWNSSDPLAGPE